MVYFIVTVIFYMYKQTIVDQFISFRIEKLLAKFNFIILFHGYLVKMINVLQSTLIMLMS